MASGVFGIPITEETLIATGAYPGNVTKRDLAEYAEKMMNAGGKDVEALKYVDNLKQKYGNGESAQCLIYNATGTTLYFQDYNDWHGHIYDTPYPSEIMNGQWGAFLHVHGFWTGAAGAVVYRSNSPRCDWLFSWSIPLVGGSNRVYTEIREWNHFPKHWNYIYHEKLENSTRHSEEKQYGCWSTTMIGEETTAVARAVFKCY